MIWKKMLIGFEDFVYDIMTMFNKISWKVN